MKIGQTVLIINSPALIEMRLGVLAGRTGKIAANAPNKSGYYVSLDTPYLKEEEWWVPTTSLVQMQVKS